jgi:hypothetical protein
MESLKGREHADDFDIYERIILKVSEIVWNCVNSIHLAQDRGQWWVLVNAVINVTVA